MPIGIYGDQSGGKMKVVFYLCIALGFVHLSAANPFYAKEKNTQNEVGLVNFAKNLPGCMPKGKVNSLYLQVDFESLKFIGVVKNQHQIKALFLDDKNNLLHFSPQDYLVQQNIQITDIDLKSVTYIAWHNIEDCHQPIKTIRLL